MKRTLVALALLAAALSGGVGRSQAVFVATSTNSGSSFTTAASFNSVAVSLTDPGTPLRGTVPLAATATSDQALVSVRFQSAPAGSGTWTDRCTDNVAPYTCDWNTAALSNGLYDLRAIALDAGGYSQTSTVISNRRVDNTAPTVSLTNPGATLTGTRTLYATASDTGGSGLAPVVFEHRLNGSTGAWTSICSDGSSPYSCNWSTAAVADGLYDLRATATDGAGNSTSSTVGSRRVDNTAPTVSLTDDGLPKAGTITVQAVLGDGNGAGVTSVRYEYRASGGGGWSEACTVSSAPFDCDIDTASVPDGLYDVRAIATDGAGFSTTSNTITPRVDNTNPSSAAMTTPGTPLSGTITLNGTGADAVGLASMRFEYRLTGTGTWTTACTDASPPSPFSCSWNTTTVADGSYDLRAVAVDQAGNTRNSTTVAARIVDNNGPVVSVTGPAQVRGTTNTVATSVTDASAIGSVVVQYRATGSTGAYTTICTDNTGPTYSCNWNVSALADGSSWELIAVATDALGRSTTSAPFTSVVNSTGPTGTDVQSTNGGTNDRLDSGDRVFFSFSAQIAPASILPGWSGTSTAIRVRVNNSGTRDTMEFYDSTNTTPLNLLATGTALTINGDHVSSASLFNATIAQSGSTVTVTIGSLISGGVRSSATGSTPMVWQPNPAMTNTTGKGLFPTTVTESGSTDVDF